jgi:hypothetical protein
MQSNMVVGKTKGLLFEWSIKTKQNNSTPTEPLQQQNSNYIEFITYKPVTY